MAIQPKNKEIAGIDYTVVPFSVIEALKLKAQLIKTLGPGILGGFGVITGAMSSLEDEEAEIDLARLGPALQQMMFELSEDKFVAIITRMVSGTSCTVDIEGQKAFLHFGDSKQFEMAMNACFQTRTMDLYILLGFILEVNYPDFFSRLAAIGGRLKTRASQRESSAPKE